MKKYVVYLKNLAFTKTAKDTYVLFAGNIGSAFWGFLFALFLARALSVSDFGIFSAANNLAIILVSVVDAGVSAGAINFISESLAKGDKQKSDEYIKASIVARIIAVSVVSVIIVLFSPFIAKKLLATNNAEIAVLTALMLIFIIPNGIFPYLFQAKKEFVKSVIVDNSFFIFRLGAAYILILLGMFKLQYAFWAFFAGFAITLILSIPMLGFNFIRSRPRKEEYKKLLGFSGWLGVNRVVSGISGRLDVAMIAALSGAVSTGIYSIPQRLASFIAVLAASYSSVLAPRMAGFSDKKVSKSYLLKASLAIVPIIGGIVFVIFLAGPFIKLLFGAKYLPAVPVFQALSASYIPFIISVPAVTFIIYSLKKTSYIGIFSFFQLIFVFLLNLFFIPRYGRLGPTFTYSITNTVQAIYAWVIVFRYHKKEGV